MRALTMDEVGCVGGGAVMEDVREEVDITGRRTSDWWNPSTYLLNPGGAFGAAGQNSGRPRYYSAAADAAGYYIDDYTGIGLEEVTVIAKRDWCGSPLINVPDQPWGNDFSEACKQHDLDYNNAIAISKGYRRCKILK
jgi:hypothetical protein